MQQAAQPNFQPGKFVCGGVALHFGPPLWHTKCLLAEVV
jgi:hypothetical protein